MNSLICLALIASSPAAVPPQSSTKVMKLPAAKHVAHALIQVQNGRTAIVMNIMEQRTQEYQVPVAYTVEVNGKQEQRQRAETRTRTITVPTQVTATPRGFTPYRLNTNGSVARADLPTSTTPAVIVKDMKHITAFHKRLLRPGTYILVKKAGQQGPR